MSNVHAVLFDLDGTLLDTAPDMVAALNALRQEQSLAHLPYLQLRPLVSHGATALVRHGFPLVEGASFEALRRRFLALYAGSLALQTRARVSSKRWRTLIRRRSPGESSPTNQED